MIIISHRGYLNGPDAWMENNPTAIDSCIKSNLFVEVDARLSNEGEIYLGHDGLLHKVDLDWISKRKERLIIHAKDLKIVDILTTKDFHWFYHENDKITLTSTGIPWCYPGHSVDRGIVLKFEDPDVYGYTLSDTVFGVCTDYPLKYINHYPATL